VLEYVPEGVKTPELCLEAVKGNGGALEYVPEGLKTPELCFEAVKRALWALQFVPKNIYKEVLKRLDAERMAR
jgi:hypothetical protein